jgi:phosphoenolpyruvate carboxylase
MTSSYEADQKPAVTLASLEAGLAAQRQRAEADPFSNAVLLFAIDLTRRIDRGEISLGDLDQLVQSATAEAFCDRARRLGAYLGETSPEANVAAVSAVIESCGQGPDFVRFRDAVGRPLAGIVFTGHPTFAMPLKVAQALTELACGRTHDGRIIDQAVRGQRLAFAQTERHRPPEALTLDVEHEWSLEALANAHQALDALHRVVFAVARSKWPGRWTELEPSLITLASWVGYDQDGRTDVTSMRSFAVRLADKSAALAGYRLAVERIQSAAPPELQAALKPAATMLQRLWPARRLCSPRPSARCAGWLSSRARWSPAGSMHLSTLPRWSP